VEELFAKTLGLPAENVIVIVVVWVVIALIIFGFEAAGSGGIVFFTSFFVFITTYVIGKLGWVIFMLILPVIIIILVGAFFMTWSNRVGPSTSSANPPPIPAPIPNINPYSAPDFSWSLNTAQPTRLYHGTSLEIAQEIYRTGLWLIGSSRPYAIWMTTSFQTAKSYAKGSGGIIEIDVSPFLQLTNLRSGIYIYEIPEAIPFGEYYKVEGLRPVGILNRNGDRIY